PDAVVINRIHDELDRLLRQRLHLRPRPPDSVLAAFERVRDRLCNKVLHRVEHVTLHPSPHNMEPALDRVPLINHTTDSRTDPVTPPGYKVLEGEDHMHLDPVPCNMQAALQ